MQIKIINNVFLTGFMGVGKSTVGKLLAELVSARFVDLDEMIEQREKRTIAEIFAAEGEDYFRECESSLLNELCLEPSTVYATGGGMVVRAENRRRMRRLGRIVYLQANWSTLKNRLLMSVGRPLVNLDKSWAEVENLWAERQVFYADADLVVDTEGDSPLAVAQKIVAGLTS